MLKNDNEIEKNIKLVLASGSSRREEIMERLDLKFTVVPSKLDESKFENDDPVERVKTLAEEKAKSVSKLVEEALIIAADTIVVYENEVLGKPEKKSEARRTLKMLNGDKHQVITALTVMNSESEEIYSVENITDVKMMELSEEEITKYVETGEPLDKAGSYAIQGLGGLFIEEIKGSYYSVMGLPIHQLAKLLDKFNYGIL